MQVCFFVRGSSCAATEVDYYLLPAELESAYLHATPAADSATTVTATTTTGATAPPTTTTATSTTTTIAENDNTSATSPGTSAVTPKKPLRLRVRPPWLETYSEQVVLLDWPLLVPQVRYQPYHILT